MVGVDTRMGQIENWNGTYTGYLEKKLIDGSVAANEHNFQTCPMPYIRLAEMYLIAAEACIELNKLDEAVHLYRRYPWTYRSSRYQSHIGCSRTNIQPK